MEKNFDFKTTGPISQISALQKLRTAHQNAKAEDWSEFFDSDVQEILKSHNSPKDEERLNAVIRALFV